MRALREGIVGPEKEIKSRSKGERESRRRGKKGLERRGWI